MFGVLKNPLLNKNIIIPIIGPIPNTNKINLAEFFVCPNSFFSFFIDLSIFLLDDFFFINTILQQINSEIIKILGFG